MTAISSNTDNNFAVLDKIQERYENSGKFTKACGFITAAAGIEMAIRSVGDIFAIVHNPVSEALKYSLSANLGGTLFYGLCALNPIPGVTALGGMIYTLYSLANPGYYFSSKVIYKSVEILNNSFQFVTESVIAPVIRKTAFIFKKVFEIILSIPLPKHPVWIGVALLVAAIATYQGIQYLRNNQIKQPSA